MKKYITLMLCLVAFATQVSAQSISSQLPIASKSELIVYALDRVHYGEVALHMEHGLMLVDGEVATTASTTRKFGEAKTTQEMSEAVRNWSVNYSVRKDIELGTPARVSQVWYDHEDFPLFEGENHAEFVLVDGRKDLDQNAYYMSLRLVHDVPIAYNDSLQEAIFVTQWGQWNLRVDNEYFFFPASYAGQEGSLVLRTDYEIIVIDTRTGKMVSTRELSYSVQGTWVDYVFTILPWNGEEKITISPWYHWDHQVFEVSRVSTLVVEPYTWSGEPRPYLMLLQNIDTGEMSQIPSTEAGEYNLDGGARYRIWFDWDAIYPTLELVSVTDTQIPGNGDNVDHQVNYRVDVTSNAGDVFIPFSKVTYSLEDQFDYEQNPPAGVTSVVAVGKVTSIYKGEQGVWVQEGTTVRLNINLYFVSEGQTSTYRLSLQSFEAWFSDDTEMWLEINDNGRWIIFYNGKG